MQRNPRKEKAHSSGFTISVHRSFQRFDFFVLLLFQITMNII
jgi:hypothetical protein